MNLRAFDIETGEVIHWNSADTVPGGGLGRSLPAPGTGIADSEGREIFCGDIVAVDDSFYLVRLGKGGFQMEWLEGGQGGRRGGWIHEFCGEGTKVSVVGNTRHNSDWLVGILRRRVNEGSCRFEGEERAWRPGGGTPQQIQGS